MVEYIALVKGHPFIGGHLFENITPNKSYLVIDKGRTLKAIWDDMGKEVWVSNTTFKAYFISK